MEFLFSVEYPLVMKEPGGLGMDGAVQAAASISEAVDGECACTRAGREGKAGLDGENQQ